MPRAFIIALRNVTEQNLAMVALEFLEAFAKLRCLITNSSPIAATASLVIGEFLLLLQHLRV
jgi:hypothetical protein